MPYATLEELSAAIGEMGNYDPAWWHKMMHRIPQAPSVQREEWLLKKCAGETVLHLGCNGPLHGALRNVTAQLYGVDQEPKQEAGYFCVDLDETPQRLPELPDVTLVLAAEVLEHLVAPGWVLKMCRELYKVPLVVTVPSAFAPQPKLRQGYECINVDHVSWYSPYTIQKLLRKCGYAVQELFYYNGLPPYSEGLIVVAAAQEQ